MGYHTLWLRPWYSHWHQDTNNDILYNNIARYTYTGIPGARRSGIILGMGSANERKRYIVMPPIIDLAHAQNHPWGELSNTQIPWDFQLKGKVELFNRSNLCPGNVYWLFIQVHVNMHFSRMYSCYSIMVHDLHTLLIQKKTFSGLIWYRVN